MKKKLLLILLVLAFSLSLLTIVVACKPYDGFTVGAIYITNSNETSGYTFAHHSGITKAMEALGLPVKDALKVVNDVPEDKADVDRAIDNLVSQGCDMIIGISFGYLESMGPKAVEYPDVIFSHATGYLSNANNFNNYFGRIYQARYLSGIAAGLKAKEMNNPKLGYVAAWGREYAETASGINAFALGAQSVYPSATVSVYQISTWGDQEKERQAAEALINLGCGVISQHCDSAQPQIVANTNGKFGVGYNSNMVDEAPDALLTSAIWNWEVYYETAIKAAMEKGVAGYIGEMGEAWYGGLKEGFVGISPLTKNVSAGTEDAINQVKQMMIDWQDGKDTGFNVFENNKLNITIGADGKATITKEATPLVKRIFQTMLDDDGKTVINKAPTATFDKNMNAEDGEVNDGVIKGSMDYFVAGVYYHNEVIKN